MTRRETAVLTTAGPIDASVGERSLLEQPPSIIIAANTSTNDFGIRMPPIAGSVPKLGDRDMRITVSFVDIKANIQSTCTIETMASLACWGVFGEATAVLTKN